MPSLFRVVLACTLTLYGCGGGGGAGGIGGSSPSGNIIVQAGNGSTVSSSSANPWRTSGDVFTVTESNYGGSFTATDLAQQPCYKIGTEGANVFTVTEGGLICDSSTVDPIRFADSNGHSTIQYFAPLL